MARPADKIQGRVTSHVRGDCAEIAAELYFVSEGFWVARTMHATCPYDLVVANEAGELMLIDVKTTYIRSNGVNKGHNRSVRRSDLQRKLGVRMVYVNLDSGEITFSRPVSKSSAKKN